MTSRLSFAAIVAVVSVGAACASSNRRSNCEPVPAAAMIGAHTVVYRDCDVDSRPTISSTMLRVQGYTPNPGTSCANALIEFVVDSTGRPDVATAKTARATDQKLADAMISTLGSLRYRPAKRDGHAVASYTSWGVTLAAFVVGRAGSGPPPPSPRC